ncbi:unnamed protein product [Lactuca saligna]|uniref:Uncharacterized protein n=1 Tax=Lactuca saligna TaxID=75948 RepID=A0AA35YK37_LACSI|nr:unnamed protein product [Lactuca saligna]
MGSPPHEGSPHAMSSPPHQDSHPSTVSPPHEDSPPHSGYSHHDTSLPKPPPFHHMHTRSKSGIVKPVHRLNIYTSSSVSVSRAHLQALKDPNWHKALDEEYNALITNDDEVLKGKCLMAQINESHAAALNDNVDTLDGDLSQAATDLKYDWVSTSAYHSCFNLSVSNEERSSPKIE